MGDKFVAARSMSPAVDIDLPRGFVDKTREVITLGPMLLSLGIVVLIVSVSVLGAILGLSLIGEGSIGWAEGFSRISRDWSSMCYSMLGILGLNSGLIMVIAGLRRTFRNLQRLR